MSLPLILPYILFVSSGHMADASTTIVASDDFGHHYDADILVERDLLICLPLALR